MFAPCKTSTAPAAEDFVATNCKAGDTGIVTLTISMGSSAWRLHRSGTDDAHATKAPARPQRAAPPGPWFPRSDPVDHPQTLRRSGKQPSPELPGVKAAKATERQVCTYVEADSCFGPERLLLCSRECLQLQQACSSAQQPRQVAAPRSIQSASPPDQHLTTIDSTSAEASH